MGGMKLHEYDMKQEAKKEKFRHVLLGLLVFCLALYGTIMLCISVHKYFKPDDFPVTFTETTDYEVLGKPGTPHTTSHTYDFSDMEQTLKGIERQLERMNDIQLKIHQEGR